MRSRQFAAAPAGQLVSRNDIGRGVKPLGQTSKKWSFPSLISLKYGVVYVLEVPGLEEISFLPPSSRSLCYQVATDTEHRTGTGDGEDLSSENIRFPSWFLFPARCGSREINRCVPGYSHHRGD